MMTGDAVESGCLSDEQIDTIAQHGIMHPADEIHLASCDTCRVRLSAARELNAFLSDAAAAHADEPGTPVAKRITVRDYDIEKELHRGAQGVVYKATQRGTQRNVALKMLLHGAHATAKQKRRFDREIELIASLRHPNIVTIFDSGETDGGGRYFAMEYVRGVHLSRVVATQRNNVPGRRIVSQRTGLGLFEKISRAVQYAHQRGVIHRDIKPSNILVDAQLDPHLVDFGLAKLLAPGGHAQRAIMTETNEFIGTFAYAAPEQVSGDPDGVDVRTDVYALGILLYELLTGQSPHPMTGAVSDVIRCITHEHASPPSTLDPSISGELDTIVLKAIAKEPDRRYQSAGALADDIRRYLRGEAIDAKRDSAWYVLQKSVGRYRWPLTAVAAIVLLLITYAISVAVLYSRASDQRDYAHRMNEFMQRMLTSISPEQARGEVVTMRDALDQAAVWVDLELTDAPLVEASIRSTIGQVYRNLGYFDEAESHLRRALELQYAHSGANESETFDTMYELGWCLYEMQRLDEAHELAERVVAARQTGTRDDASKILHGLNLRSLVDKRSGRLEAAENGYREALATSRRQLGQDDPMTLAAMNNLGVFLNDTRKYKQATELLQDVLQRRCRVLGEDHPATLSTMNNYASALRRGGQPLNALPLYERVVDLRRSVLGETHRRTITSVVNVASLYLKLDMTDAAVKTAGDTWRAFETDGQRPSNEWFRAGRTYALALAAHGECAMCKAVLDQISTSAGSVGAALLSVELADCLVAQGSRPEAIALLEASYQAVLGAIGADDPRSRFIVRRLDQLKAAAVTDHDGASIPN